MQEIISKIRDLIGDNLQFNSESHEFIISKIFSLQYANIDESSLLVSKNGILWAPSNYSYNSNTGKITITGTITVGEVLEFTYNAYNKYSNNELKGYIRSALYNLSVEQYETLIVESGNILYSALTGAVVVTNLSNIVTGVSTVFTTELKVGDTIKIQTEIFIISTINSNTNLTLDNNYQGASASGLFAYRTLAIPQQNLIAIIASILIKGSIRSYRTPEISIVFEEGISVEKKIKQLINQFSKSFGSINYTDLSKTFPTE